MGAVQQKDRAPHCQEDTTQSATYSDVAPTLEDQLMCIIYQSDNYILEIHQQPVGDLVTLDFNVTYPQALRPTNVRKAQFTLPREAIHRLAVELLPYSK